MVYQCTQAIRRLQRNATKRNSDVLSQLGKGESRRVATIESIHESRRDSYRMAPAIPPRKEEKHPARLLFVEAPEDFDALETSLNTAPL